MSATLEQAIERAVWFTRYALDRARSDPTVHPGLTGHLTAMRVQADAVEQLAAQPAIQQPTAEAA